MGEANYESASRRDYRLPRVASVTHFSGKAKMPVRWLCVSHYARCNLSITIEAKWSHGNARKSQSGHDLGP